MESEVITKSSNEILTELFGAFNSEPPTIKIKKKQKCNSEGNESKHEKKSKKSKKLKKKHKSKSKKKKRKQSGSDSESESVRKKKSKNKKKKKHECVQSVNIELPVNKVPMALEIMLDGTVGIKGEDGVITKIPDVSKNEINGSETENKDCKEKFNGCDPDFEAVQTVDVITEADSCENKTELKSIASEPKIPLVFETLELETGKIH